MPKSARASRVHQFLIGSTAIGLLLLPVGALAQVAPVTAPAPSPEAPGPEANPAQDEEKTSLDTNEIVVTAQRRTERVQDVPISITALTGEQLKNAAVTAPDRLEQLVPGLRMGRSGSDLRPAMRGTYTENVAANGDPRFGIYVDDIYQSRTSQVPPIVDLDRVEVQKGPQGTLYGRNSFGGNIAFFSAKPTDRLQAGIDVLYGRYDHGRVEGFVNLPVTDGVSLRVAGLWEESDGYVKNIGTGNDYGGEEQQFIRGTLRIAPKALDDRLEIMLRASYLDLGGEGLGGFGYKILGTQVDQSLIRAPGESLTYNGVTYLLPNGFNGNSFTGTGVPIDTRFRDGIPDINGADIGIPTIDDPYKVNYAGNIFRDGSQKQFSGTISFNVGPATLRSISSYTDFDLVRTGGSLTPILLNYSYGETTAKTYTQELQVLSSNRASPFQWIVGGYYFNDTARDRSVTNVNRSYVTATAPIGQQYFPFGFTFLPSGTGFNQTFAYDGFGAQQQKTRSLAAYGQLSYTFFDKLTVTGGLRYTSDRKKVLASRFNTFPGSSPLYFAHDIDDPIDYKCGGFIAANSSSNAPAAAIATAYNFVCAKQTFNYLSYRLAADYKLGRDNMVYASYSTGQHAGGFNTGPVTINRVPTLLPFAPEKVEAFEIGSKNRFLDGKLTLNAAAFLNNYRDLQAQTSIPNPNAPLTSVIALVQNIGKDRAYGIDIDAVYRPKPNLRLTLAYNWLHARELDYAVNTFNFGGTASFCGITPSCIPATGETNTVQGTPFPNARTDPNRFVPVLDSAGNQVISGGVPQFRYVIAGRGLDGTKYTSRKAFSPDHTVQAGIAYDIDLGRRGTLTPEVQTYFNSGYILTDLTPNFGHNPSFTKTDLRVTYRTANDRFRLQAFVQNIEDEATISRAVYTNHRALLVNYAQPRTWGLNAGYRF